VLQWTRRSRLCSLPGILGGAPLSTVVGLLAHIAMKRHVLLALFRLLLALGVAYALPLSHARWGERYPGDGQQAFGFIIIFFVMGLTAAAVFVGLGSLGQFLFRKRSARFTVFTDLALFLAFTGVLIYGGMSARYHDTQPNHSIQRTGASRSVRAVIVTQWLLAPAADADR
jgi:hypothetical protein